MVQFLLQSFVFVLASLTSAGLIYLSHTYQFYQQLIPVLLIIDIAIASRIKSNDNPNLNLPKVLIIYTSSLLVQTIVISSGGFYSPLLILLHIFTLGAILLLGSSSPILFLVSSLGVLIFHISYDKNLYQFFQNDPWSVAIYALSIVIVIPLALYLSHSNSVKTKFNNFLKDYIEMSEKRQKSILTALSNMVIITDKNLNVASINIAVERLLRTSIHQVQGKPISEILTLKDAQGVRIIFDNLPIKEALHDKATHIVEGYYLETKIEALAKPITLQIRPLTDPSNEVTQIVFVLTDPLVKVGFNTHPSVADTVKKRDALLKLLTNSSTPLSESSAQQVIMLITHLEEDILTVQEMEDHPLQEVIGFVDLVTIAKQTIALKSYFYLSIGNVPEVTFEDPDKSESAFLNLHMEDLGQINLSKYTAAVDSYLLKLLLEKIFDLSVILSSTSKVQVGFSIVPDNVKIDITFPSLSLAEKDLPNLFTKNYPGIKLASLQKSSGLEGYIISKISRALSLPIETHLNPYKKTITITLVVKKQAPIHTDSQT